MNYVDLLSDYFQIFRSRLGTGSRATQSITSISYFFFFEIQNKDAGKKNHGIFFEENRYKDANSPLKLLTHHKSTPRKSTSGCCSYALNYCTPLPSYFPSARCLCGCPWLTMAGPRCPWLTTAGPRCPWLTTAGPRCP